MKKPTIHKAANGHTTIDFEEYDSPAWFKAVSILEADNFIRSGKPVIGFDEGILPSFVKGEIKISAGWDNWSGNYLLSESVEGSKILNELFLRL